MSLIDAIAAAREYRQSLDPTDLIDEKSGFSAEHLDLLIDWADTCGEIVTASDEDESLRDLDVTQLGDSGLADFYFRELEVDPDLTSEAGRRLREEVDRRALSEEQLATALERTRQQHEAVNAAEKAERDEPPHFPDDLEIPTPV